MSVQQELKNLLQNQVIPDVEDALDEIYEEINATKNAPQELKEEVEELQDFKADLKDIVKDIESGDIDNEEAQAILDDIKSAMDGELE
jgi:polyhydroxyalkanoate synthesis regulator phasin